MRSLAGIGLLLLAAFVVAGCDSDIPLEFKQRNSDISFVGGGAKVAEYVVFDLFEDSEDLNDDGVPEGDGIPDGDVALYCQRNKSGMTGTFRTVQAPWPFSVQIKVLKAGQISPRTVVASLESPPDFNEPERTNLTDYDETEVASSASPPADVLVVRNDGSCSGDSSVACDPDDATDSCDSAGKGTCLAEGTCDVGNEDCFVSPSSFLPCINAPFAPCDCVALSAPPPGSDLGVCCTSDQFGVDLCNVNNLGKCTKQPAVGCRPGCSELGSGTTCNPATNSRLFKFESPGC